MSFLDKFRKKSKNLDEQKSDLDISNNEEIKTPTSYKLKVDELPNGNYSFSFRDYKFDPKKFYDTTYVEINPNGKNIAGRTVYEASVAWYNEDDEQVYNEKTGKLEYLEKNNATKVMLEADLNSLANNPEYPQLFMRSLVSEDRVRDYLNKGMQENPKGYKRGNYLGGVEVDKQTGKPQKIFHTSVGEAIHDSPEMVKRREEIANIRKAELQRRIRIYEEETEKNKSEVNKTKKELQEIDNSTNVRKTKEENNKKDGNIDK